MKRNAFLVTMVLLCLTTAAVAADQKKNVQPPSTQTQQTPDSRNGAGNPRGHVSSAQGDCLSKPEKRMKLKDMQNNGEGDPVHPRIESSMAAEDNPNPSRSRAPGKRVYWRFFRTRDTRDALGSNPEGEST